MLIRSGTGLRWSRRRGNESVAQLREFISYRVVNEMRERHNDRVFNAMVGSAGQYTGLQASRDNMILRFRFQMHRGAITRGRFTRIS